MIPFPALKVRLVFLTPNRSTGLAFYQAVEILTKHFNIISEGKAAMVEMSKVKKEKATTAKTKTAAKPKATKVAFEYMEGIGRRKTATARVRAAGATKAAYIINGKSVEEYFELLQSICYSNSKKS